MNLLIALKIRAALISKMLTHITCICLILSTTSLRIQQKEKAKSRCPSHADACPVDYNSLNAGSDAANPDSSDAMCHKCMCYLEGYRVQDMPGDSGYTLGACGSKVQAATAMSFQNHMYGCAANYMKFGSTAVDGDSLARGRWHDLFNCVTNNLPISTRAVVNPLGVNSYWVDPLVQGQQTQQIQNAYISKKLDYPGSLPAEDCTAGRTRSTDSWVTVCDHGTQTFDGPGGCCISFSGLTGATTTDLGSHSQPGGVAACKAAAVADSSCNGELLFLNTDLENHSPHCWCGAGIKIQPCGPAHDASTGQPDPNQVSVTDAAGSYTAVIFRQVLLCT